MSDSTAVPVGFIGLGQIGKPMAQRLTDWPGGLTVWPGGLTARGPSWPAT